MTQARPSPVYLERVNVAVDHVVAHLHTSVRLEEVAAAAGFSRFHFHRIFRSLMGETLKQFVTRLRLERALGYMSHHPELSLTEVAHRTGFAASSDFSRSFKKRYGVPPSHFDVRAHRAHNRERMQEAVEGEGRGPRLRRLPPGENPDGFEVRLRDVPARRVAYVRVARPFESDHVVKGYERLMHWAEAHGAEDGAWLGYMWDDPELVALEQCRYHVGLVTRDEAQGGPALPEGDVGVTQLPPMVLACVAIRGSLALEQRAIDWLWGTWLPRSGYVPDDQPAFEAWHGRPFAHGMEHFELSVQLPVVRL